ncbi:hypothetical protein [Liquorilactobacillus vini]|nr:hypothetical protein [Liquorilactobacillus vini]
MVFLLAHSLSVFKAKEFKLSQQIHATFSKAVKPAITKIIVEKAD